MYCIKCGKPIEKDAAFCRYCGAKLSLEPVVTISADTAESETDVQDSEMLEQNNDVLLCLYCGTENTPGDKICVNCGKELPVLELEHGIEDYAASATPTASQLDYSSGHPYHQLGGWLALITYGLLIGTILTAISAALQVLPLFKYASYLGFKVVLFGLLLLACHIPLLYYCIHMFKAIKAKDSDFLRFYETTMLVLAGIDVAVVVLCKLLGQYVPTNNTIRDLLSAAIVFAIWLTYFRKSVRVRTYFGSDEYLKRSIFLKNCTAPEPADRR